MKNFFPGEYRPSDEDLATLWKEGTFVFDTNVLLNLYSYPESVRDVFISVLEKICGRSWIPYQVAQEFHRNRFARIKQANTPLINLRNRIRATSEELESEIQGIEFEKRNTGVDNLGERLQAVKAATSMLAEALDKACERLPKVGLEDPIAQRLSILFEKNVGNPPADQAALDSIIQDGEDRYDKKIPPGFEDAKKKKDIVYYDREITYLAKFGDLIIWRQVIEYVKKNEIKNVIFVTGDRKDDWWKIVDNKTLGPLPDLVREFTLKSQADRFWMYTTDQFLKFAETYLSANEVTPEAVEQVREISSQNEIEQKPEDYSNILLDMDHIFPKFLGEKKQEEKNIVNRNRYMHAMESVNSHVPVTRVISEWLYRNYKIQKLYHADFPDLVISTEDGISGFEIISAPIGVRGVLQRVSRILERAESLPYELSLIVFLEDEVVEPVIERLLGGLCNVLAGSSIRSVIVGDVFLNEFNVRKKLTLPER